MGWSGSRRRLLLGLLLATSACQLAPRQSQDRFVIGVISYGEGERAIQQFTAFDRYLGERTRAKIELEPAFNENKALERIQAHDWSLVFAPPGLAAIAIARHQYLPFFPLQGVKDLRSVLVVRKDSSIQVLKQVEGQAVALGQLGSATGYYFPLYNLYGLTLAQVLFSPTPRTTLEWVAQGKAAVGALSLAEFNQYRPKFPRKHPLRVLHVDPHQVPPGVVLIEPTLDRNRQERIRQIMSEVSSALAQQVGYIPNVPVPDYDYMISVVERVRSIAVHLNEKPARLF